MFEYKVVVKFLLSKIIVYRIYIIIVFKVMYFSFK